MQPFWFFVAIPKALPTVAKELGVCTLRARFAGGKATTNKKVRIYRNNYFFINFFVILFPDTKSFYPSGTLYESANILTLYDQKYTNKIIPKFQHKNAAFLVLCGNKRTGGVYPKGTLRRGLVPTNILNLQNITFNKLKNLVYI